MNLPRAVLVTHRWLGLTIGAIMAIAGITGAVLTWPGSSPVQKASDALHESLAMGSAGTWVVLIATAASIVLQLAGAYLWWKSKRRTIRVRGGQGWRCAIADLHFSVGILAVPIMLLLAGSAVGRAVVDPSGRYSNIRSAVSRLHTAKDFPVVMKALYTAGSLGFVALGVTGVLMWWRPRR